MEGSNLIFHRLAIVPADPGIGIALPVIADRRAGRRPSDGQSVDARLGAGTLAIPATRADTAGPDHGAPGSQARQPQKRAAWQLN